MKIRTFLTLLTRVKVVSVLLLTMAIEHHNANAIPVSYDVNNIDSLASYIIAAPSHVTNGSSDGINDSSYTFSYTAANGATSPSNVYISIDLANAVRGILSSSSTVNSLTLEFDFISSTQTNGANQSFTVWGSSAKAASGVGVGTSSVDSWKFAGTGAGWFASTNGDLLSLDKVVAGSVTRFSIAIDLGDLTYSITATNGASSGTVSNLSWRDNATAPSATDAGSLSYLNIILAAGASADAAIDRSATISNIRFSYDDGAVIPEPKTSALIFGAILFFCMPIIRRLRNTRTVRM